MIEVVTLCCPKYHRSKKKLNKSTERMAFPEAHDLSMVTGVAIEVEISKQEAGVVDHRPKESVIAAAPRVVSARARARRQRRRRRHPRLGGRGIPVIGCAVREMNSGTCRRGWVSKEASGSRGIVTAARARSARGGGDVVRDEGGEHRRRRF